MYLGKVGVGPVFRSYLTLYIFASMRISAGNLYSYNNNINGEMIMSVGG
jgi:hypothetical protein